MPAAVYDEEFMDGVGVGYYLAGDFIQTVKIW